MRETPAFGLSLSDGDTGGEIKHKTWLHRLCWRCGKTWQQVSVCVTHCLDGLKYNFSLEVHLSARRDGVNFTLLFKMVLGEE